MQYELNRVYRYRELGSRAKAALRRKVQQLKSFKLPVPRPEDLEVMYRGEWPSTTKHAGGPYFVIMHADDRIATSFVARSII